MAAKSKEKKEKGKKGKHKAEKTREEKIAEAPVAGEYEAMVATAPMAKHATPAAAAKPQSDSTADAILDAVIDCVASGGIEGITTRRIAAQAGVNEVTIFRHFGNKEALLQAVVARETARMRAAAAPYSGNLEADLVRVVHVIGDTLVQRAAVVPILMESARKGTETRGKAQHSLSAFGEVATLLERYMREGALRKESPQAALSALIGPLVFGTLLATTAGAKTPPVNAEAHVRDFLFGRAVKARS